MNQSKIFYGTNFWEDGRTSVDDDERPGRKSTSATPENVAKFRKAILADRRQTIHDVCEIVGLSYGNVQRILADNLNIRNISARFLPRLLSDVHTAHHVSVCRELKQQARDDPNFIFNIITGDEAWVYCCESETLQQLSQWKQSNSPRPKKARQVCSSVKFSDIQGTVHKEFLPPGQTVNGKFYCEVLKRLREGIRRRRPDKWKNNDWFLHHDNAPAHTSLVVRQFPDFQKRYRDSPPPIRLTSLLRLFPILQDEITAEMESFWQYRGDPRRIARGYRHSHTWELPEMHEIMGNTLGSLYTCPKGLLRRRRWKLGTTVRNFFCGKIPRIFG